MSIERTNSAIRFSSNARRGHQWRPTIVRQQQDYGGDRPSPQQSFHLHESEHAVCSIGVASLLCTSTGSTDDFPRRTALRWEADLRGQPSDASEPSPLNARWFLVLSFRLARLIGIAATVPRPLPHHRAYGSVHGGSSRLREHPSIK